MKITNKHNLPRPLARALQGWQSPFVIEPGKISLTTLLNPIQQTILRARYDDKITEDVADRSWLMGGSADHKVLEEMGKRSPGCLVEIPMQVVIAGWTIGMKADLWDSETRTLSDYKRTSVWSYVFAKSSDHEAQLNSYAMALQSVHDLIPEKLQVIQEFRDWQKSKVGANYPPIPFGIIEVKKWQDGDTFLFLLNRIKILETFMENSDQGLCECTAEERWEKPTTYAVTKVGRKSALRLLDSMEAANSWIAQNNKGDGVETRYGKSTRCEEYCNVKPFCCQYNKKPDSLYPTTIEPE